MTTNLEDNSSPRPTNDANSNNTSKPDVPTESATISHSSFTESSVPVSESDASNVGANSATTNENQEQVSQPGVEVERVSPEAESLKAMFPDFDTTIIQSVLDSVNGNQERAADVLLGMSDPSYESQQHAAPVLSQTELDEQLARRLMMEEHQAQAAWHPDQAYPMQEDRRRSRLPYQPYQGQHQNQSQWRNDQGSGRDTMTEVQEQFNRIAETGKKTFSQFVTKVKAKIQEFDQSRNQGTCSQQSSWGSGTPGGSYNQPIPPQSQPQSQYYAPTPNQDASHEIAITQAQGYDTTPNPTPDPVSKPVNTVSASPPPANIPPRPPSAGPPPAGNVDPTKIGMLPKRPVSLLGTTSPQSKPVHQDDDDDELEYAENPFEDGKK